MLNDDYLSDYDEDDDEDEICGYVCLACGSDFDHPEPFHECPSCGCGELEPIYF